MYMVMNINIFTTHIFFIKTEITKIALKNFRGVLIHGSIIYKVWIQLDDTLS